MSAHPNPSPSTEMPKPTSSPGGEPKEPKAGPVLTEPTLLAASVEGAASQNTGPESKGPEASASGSQKMAVSSGSGKNAASAVPLRVLAVASDEPRGALAADPPLHPTDEFLAELERESQSLESATPQEILRWAVDRFSHRFTMATAFGPEGMTIIHMLSQIAPETPVFNLDTGYQFAETLELRERVKERYGIEVELKRPDTTVQEYEAANGGPLHQTNPNQCCFDRKLRVLHEAAKGKHAWASAIRRDQSPDRATAPIVGWDRKFQLVKISPLANWTKKDVWGLIASESIPYNPLHDRGYPSVGCWPCTREVLIGEDERAGRWSGFQKTECGLHTS